MVMIPTYDPSQHKPTQLRVVLPAGWYAAQIIQSEVKFTKNKKNQLLELVLELLEQVHPELKGRRVWERLNLWHTTSQDAVDFSNRTLSSICKAIGQLDQWEDSSVLHNRPLAVKLKVRAADANYEENNEVKEYDSIASRPQLATGGAGGPAKAPMAPPEGQPGHVAAPPWQQPKKE